MDIMKLAQEIVAGRRLGRKDDLSFFEECNLEELCKGADLIRENLVGEKVDLCAIINGRSGKCPEDCKYCAQSSHYQTDCKVYPFISEDKIVENCKLYEREGADRYSIVTAGKNLNGEEFKKALRAYERMGKECKIGLCASMGFLSEEQLLQLKEVGVTNYHCNIETSRANFPNICTTHSFEQKLEMVKKIKRAGLNVCSGGIIGMGETWKDRIDMALELAELDVASIPLNSLMAIKGTPFENMEKLSEKDILRTVAIFRFINPDKMIRLAAGRALLTGDGEIAFKSGASATITGDMLTTAACATIRSDREMLKGIGRTVAERM